MKTRFLLLVALLLLLLGTPAFAQNQAPVANATAQNDSAALAASKQPQLPRLIRFSGTVRNADGSPRTGVVGMTFALYKDQQDGAPLWQEVQNVRLDSNGRYSILLGAEHAEGLPLDLFSSNEAHWLGVQVETESELPRVLLVAVPYALKAADAETVGGHPLTDFVLTPTANASTSGSGASGNTTSGGSTTMKKSATSPAVSSSPVTTAGGTQNFVAKFDSSGTNLINSSIFDNGNVGIGTSTPAAKLEVGGAIGEAFRMTGVGTNPVAFRFTNAGNSAYFGIESSTAGGYFSGSLPYSTVIYSPQPIQNIVGGVSRMIIHTNGNVGIGTVSPTSRLTVAGTVESTSGGFRFPDSSIQTTAATGAGGTVTSVTAGTGLVATPLSPITSSGTLAVNFTAAGGNNGSATTVARSDHLHDLRYVQLAPLSFSYSNASVSGRYAFSAVGAFTSSGLLYIFNLIGVMQTDGSGHITSGSMTEVTSAGTCQNNLTGAYSVGSSGQGAGSLNIVPITIGCTGNVTSLSLQVTQQGASIIFAESDSVAWMAGTALRQ